jgi:hypothetical protein
MVSSVLPSIAGPAAFPRERRAPSWHSSRPAAYMRAPFLQFRSNNHMDSPAPHFKCIACRGGSNPKCGAKRYAGCHNDIRVRQTSNALWALDMSLESTTSCSLSQCALQFHSALRAHEKQKSSRESINGMQHQSKQRP